MERYFAGFVGSADVTGKGVDYLDIGVENNLKLESLRYWTALVSLT